MSRDTKRLALILTAIALVSIWIASKEFRAIDACLDSGGSYDNETRSCDHEASHPAGPE